MVPQFDAIVVGGGFAGIRMLYLLRENGFRVRGIERYNGLGGVWYANRYPGARPDSPQPFYQIQDETLAGDWTFSERFPEHAEMREYFQYVDAKWHVSKDFDFGVEVTQASFAQQDCLWYISLSNGQRLTARWFIPAVGFASTPCWPEIPGVDRFQGKLYHTGRWPRSGVSLQGKRVAVIGTGASGAQVVARVAPEVGSLTVYQRTPAVVIPASPESPEYENPQVVPLTPEGSRTAFQRSLTSFSGLDYAFKDSESVAIGSPLRDVFNVRAYKEGSLALIWGNFSDVLTNTDANKQLYVFWAKQTRAKIEDPVKQDILAPLQQPYPIGVRRACFVDNYYESFNRPNVNVIDVRKEPLVEITATGIKSGPNHYEYDVIICATGFESPTAGITRMNITGRDGLALTEAWKDRISTYLGLSVPGFPNMFYIFGPQGPTVKVNVPTTIECQSQWILRILEGIRASRVDCCEPTRSAAREWQKELKRYWKDSLYLATTLWEARNPANQPEPLWIQGIQKYHDLIHQARVLNFSGFAEVRPRHAARL